MNDARVVCRMKGMGKALSYCSSNRDVCSSNGLSLEKVFPAGSGKIWLDDLRCSGNESSLFDCAHAGVGVENCVSSEDIGVVCESKRIPSLKF